MPRAPKHELNAETVLARRIGEERQARGWTHDGLAARMLTEAGYKIAGSAIWKVEHGQRRVIVNELQAYCLTFKVPPARLLTPVTPEGQDEDNLFNLYASLQVMGKYLFDVSLTSLKIADPDLTARMDELAAALDATSRRCLEVFEDRAPQVAGYVTEWAERSREVYEEEAEWMRENAVQFARDLQMAAHLRDQEQQDLVQAWQDEAEQLTEGEQQ